MINFRIEDSALPLIGDKAHQVLLRSQQANPDRVQAWISGQPISVWLADGSEQYFDDCPEIIETPMTIGRVAIFRLAASGHEHIPERYIPTRPYASLQGFATNGTEYRMGMLDILSFEIS